MCRKLLPIKPETGDRQLLILPKVGEIGIFFASGIQQMSVVNWKEEYLGRLARKDIPQLSAWRLPGRYRSENAAGGRRRPFAHYASRSVIAQLQQIGNVELGYSR